MKSSMAIIALLMLALMTGCGSSSNSMALKSQKHKLRGIYDAGDEAFAESGFDDAFTPLDEKDLHMKFADAAIPQPSEIPGAEGGRIPSLDQFKKAMAGLAQIFQNVHFRTDEYVLRKSDDMQIVDRAAAYLRANPHTYVAVGGHCDERGSESYNLALGTRRANYVRTLLVERGVSSNQVHSVSYGKEQPEVFSHDTEAWAINRRAEFKIYER